jgi:hypothetical protein
LLKLGLDEPALFGSLRIGSQYLQFLAGSGRAQLSAPALELVFDKRVVTALDIKLFLGLLLRLLRALNGDIQGQLLVEELALLGNLICSAVPLAVAFSFSAAAVSCWMRRSVSSAISPALRSAIFFSMSACSFARFSAASLVFLS